MVMKRIGILDLQGAVSEHISIIHQLGAIGLSIKHPDQLGLIDGLIIPGGESTVISRLIQKKNFYKPIKQFVAGGNAVFGTCAGLILCGTTLIDSHQSNQLITPLALINISIERNGFGRQIDSFETHLTIPCIGEKIPTVFIRAPYITAVGYDVDILAQIDRRIVMARNRNVLVSAFHPELTEDNRVINYFLSMVNKK